VKRTVVSAREFCAAVMRLSRSPLEGARRYPHAGEL